ncbi:DUF3566 domain-containing protein [Nocardioides insulae]|uniref:DUF3566 domain-containing protein n=1 Tax=Nocardioides insulae TaxID=394734 RepID=UPI00041AA2F8|nr:DUF3566 domain-containing protein [Nocardioides insulae]
MTERPVERTAPRPAVTPGAEDTAVRPLTERIRTSFGASPEKDTEGGAASPPPAADPEPAKQKPTKQKRTSPSRSPRRAQLRLTRVDPWSVMKTSFLLSIAIGVVTLVSVFIVWSVLDAAGVWASINQTVQEIVGGEDAASFDIEAYLGTSRVMGFTMVVAVVDVVLLTAIGTLSAFLYNMAAALLGGVEVTLTEDND